MTTLESMVQDALEKYDGDIDKTVSSVFKNLTNNKELLRSLILEIAKLAIDTQARWGMRKNRSAIFRDSDRHYSNPQGPSDVSAMANVVRSCLLDFPMANGTKLRDATKEEVLAQADIYGRQASDMHRKELWLRLIADKVPPNKVVGDFVSDDEAAELLHGKKDAA